VSQTLREMFETVVAVTTVDSQPIVVRIKLLGEASVVEE